MMPQKPSQTRKVLVFTAAVALTALIVIAALILPGTKKPATASPQASAQATASTTPTPTPANTALAPSAPTYTGFDALQTYGVTDDERDDAQYGFVKFAKATNLSLASVAVDTTTVSVVTHDRNSTNTNDTATFAVTLNDHTKYRARFVFSDLSNGELFLTDPATGKQIYDSGLINLYKGIGD